MARLIIYAAHFQAEWYQIKTKFQNNRLQLIELKKGLKARAPSSVGPTHCATSPLVHVSSAGVRSEVERKGLSWSPWRDAGAIVLAAMDQHSPCEAQLRAVNGAALAQKWPRRAN
ncbi:hypothetical protein EYF80_014617 [Liparis tanakae]|uniref:Uncharacterized protein n=1 Tax=Liparis tanakae TaxID=230148 RepID=A0A4Z2IB65_9TELE|nr:hypothetical protein EYF80_014617 [Liparis tanakae]